MISSSTSRPFDRARLGRLEARHLSAICRGGIFLVLLLVSAGGAESLAQDARAIEPARLEIPVFGEWQTIASPPLPSKKIFCVVDAGATTWVGTEQGLAAISEEGCRTFTTEEGLAHQVVTSVSVSERTGDAWIGTMGGLSRLSGGRIDSFDQLDSGLINDVVYAVRVVGDDVWVATAAGVSVYHTLDRRWELFDHTNTLMHEPWCYSLASSATHVYVAVWGGGVVERDLARGIWKAHRDPDHEAEIDLLRDDGLIHDVTSSVSHAEGILWVGTYFGLSRYDGRTWRSYLDHDTPLPSNFINFVFARGSEAWICTDDGLAVFDGSSWLVYRSARSDGSRASLRWVSGDGVERVAETPAAIAHDYVLGVHPRGDVVWVATAAGLSRGSRLEASRVHWTPSARAPRGED